MTDDSISRQDAIDAFYDAFCYAYCDNCGKEMNEDLCGDCHRKYQNWSASKKIIEKVINNLPSAQPERKKGRWIKATGMMPPEFHGHHCCSECGNFANMEPPFGNREDLSKFCPNCGADMRGEANELV